MVKIFLLGDTIPCSVSYKYSAAKIILKPAPPGSGIIAGGAMRVVLESCGVRNVVGKILGTNNKAANVYATFHALQEVTRIDKVKKERKR